MLRLRFAGPPPVGYQLLAAVAFATHDGFGVTAAKLLAGASMPRGPVAGTGPQVGASGIHQSVVEREAELHRLGRGGRPLP